MPLRTMKHDGAARAGGPGAFGLLLVAAAACSNKSADVVRRSWGSDCEPGAGALCSFPPAPDPGPGGILFAASGEVLALTGYPFPPANAGDPAFVDGWDVHFDHVLVTVDRLTLSNNPDLSLGDQSQTGSLAAEIDGPWAVDLARSDPSYLQGKGGPGEQAVPIASLGPNGAVASDGTRYAFGFDLVTATTETSDARRTMNVNLDDAALADYAQMVAQGCAVLYVGTATFKGGAACNQGHEDWPAAVDFRLCFPSPASYLNCQNPDNDPATPFPNEEHQRGIALSTSQSVVAQITVHTDHPFWDSVLHDSPAHFDQFAARVVTGADGGTNPGVAVADGGAMPGANPQVTLDLTRGVDYSQYTDALGRPVDWRYCIDPPTDVHPRFSGRMSFDPQNVPACTNDDPGTGLCDYRDFSIYDQSTQGHLNSDGLCFVERHYPSPR